jgi:DNA-binding NarL/FixJ family response regulator
MLPTTCIDRRKRGPRLPVRAPTLTPVLAAVAFWVGEAMSNEGIGRQMNLAPGTVKQYVFRVYGILGFAQERDTNSRVRLARWAWERAKADARPKAA